MPDVSEIRDRYVLETHLEDNLSGPSATIAGHLDKMEESAIAAGKAIADAAASVGKSGATIAASNQDWDRFARKNDDLTAAMMRLKTAQDLLQKAQIAAADALRSGGATQDQVTRVLANMSDNVTRAAEKVLDLRAETEAAEEAQRHWNATLGEGGASLDALTDKARAFALVSQAAFNQGTGVKDPTSATDYAKRTQDIAAYGSALDAQRAKFDPLFAASKRYETALNELNVAIRTGAIPTQALADQALEQLNASYTKSVSAIGDSKDAIEEHGLTARQNEFILHSFVREAAGMTTELANGVPVVDILSAGIVRLGTELTLSKRGFAIITEAFGEIVKAVVSPMGLAIGAVGAFIGIGVAAGAHMIEIATEAHALDTAIAGVGRSAELASGELQEMVNKLALAGVARPDANSIIATLARNPSLSQEQIGAVAGQTQNLAAALGISPADAAKQLGEAAAGSFDAIKKLDDQMNFLSVDQRPQIQLMLEHGQRTDAVRVAMDALATSIGGLHDKSLTDLKKIQQDLKTGWDEFIDSVLHSDTLTDILKTYVQGFKDLAGAMRDARQNDAGDPTVTGVIVPRTSLGGGSSISDQAQARLDATKEVLRLETAIKDQQKQQQDALLAGSQAGANALQKRIDDLGAQLKVAREIMANGNPLLGGLGGGGPGLGGEPELKPPTPAEAAASVDLQRQAKAAADLNVELKKQEDLRATAVTDRARVRAEQEFDAKNLTLRLTGDQLTIEKQKFVANAVAEASDAYKQSVIAQDAATKAATDGAAATDRGRVAFLQASAAAQAHAEALHTVGLNEQARTQAILEGNAASELQKSKAGNLDIQDQIDANHRLAAAIDEVSLHQAEVTNQAIKTTQAVLAAAEASKDPARIAAAQAQVDAAKRLNVELDRSNALLLAQKGFIADQQQLAFLNEEIKTLGLSADARQIYLSHFKNEIALRNQLGDQFDALGPKYLAEKDAIDQATLTLQKNQTALSTVSQSFQSAFDTIGNAITQAFVSGQGKAVNWGNVMTAVAQQVLQAFLKLAVINPILNSLFSQNNTTAGDVVNALNSSGGGGGTIASGGGGGSLISTGGSLVSSASSLSGALGGPTIGSSLGLTGQGGLFTATSGGLFYAGASAPSNLIAANSLAGVYETGTAGAPGALGGLSGGVSGVLNTSLGASLGSSATIGTALGGIGGGFAAGSLIGGLEQGALNKTGPAPEVGAATGAIAGAIIGSFVPVIGTLLGGLIGGAIGGAGGGFIGPHTASVFSTTPLTVGQGSLQFGNTIQQGVDEFGREKPIKDQSDALTQFLQANRLAATSQTGAIQIGINNPGGFQDPTKFLDLNTPNVTGNTAFSMIRFSSPDPIEQEKLANKSFTTTADFQTWVTGFNAAQTSVKTFLSDTTAVMKALGAQTGTVNDSIKAITDAYTNDKTAMDALLAGGFLSDQQTKDLTKAEADLVHIRDQSLGAIQAQVDLQRLQFQQNLTSRDMTALATISGNPQDALAQQLYAFDINAAKELTDFKAQQLSALGTAYLTSAKYLADVNQLEKTHGDERLAIIAATNKAITDQAQNGATSLVNSLRSFVTSITTGADSPLSPSAKLAAAQKGFASDAAGAAGGDANALGRLSTSGQTLLAAAKAYYGSSTGYTAVFNEVLNSIGGVARMSPDALTAAFKAQGSLTPAQNLALSLTGLKSDLIGAGAGGSANDNILVELRALRTDTTTATVVELRSQTQSLVDEIRSLKAEVSSLRRDAQAAALAPSRIAS